MKANTTERFMRNVEPEPMSGCWLWSGNVLQKDGYGQFSLDGKNTTAHRASWRLHRGEITSSSVFVCHKCDNPTCVNPDHLFLGTQSDNMFDMHRKKRHWKSSQTHCARGHELTDANTYGARRRCFACLCLRERSPEKLAARRAKYHAQKAVLQCA